VEELPGLLWREAGSAKGQLEGTALEEKVIRNKKTLGANQQGSPGTNKRRKLTLEGSN
jgi:hypothetical protein